MAGQRGLISNQFDFAADQELTPEEAASACGPTAALAFARYTGRNPTIGEALSLAKQVGWTPSLGMAGPGSEVKLLGQLGVSSSYQQGASPDAVAQEVQAGRPVIVDTPNHYFAMDGYNPSTGQFHVGGSGLALRGGSEWMTWDQIAARGGGARGAIFVQGDQMATQKSTMQDAGGSTTGAASTATSSASDDVLSGLKDELTRAQAERDRLTKAAQEVNPTTGRPTTAALDAQDQLPKVSADIRQLLTTIATRSATSDRPTPINPHDPYVFDPKTGTMIPNQGYVPSSTDVSSPSSQQWIVTRDANGVQHKELNPNYIAPTMVGGVPIDDAIKTAQLLRDNLLLQVEQGRLTNETAAQIFTQQWSANVDGPLKLQEARLAEQVAAETASHNAQDIAVRSLQYRVGPGFGTDFARGNTTLAGGGGKIAYNPNDFTFDMPNFTQIGQQAANQVTSQLGTSWADRIGSQITAAQGQVGSFGQAHPADRVLAAISPTAAANVGAPPPNVAAIPSMAAAVPYVAPGAAPVAAQPGPTPYVGSGMRDRG